VTKGGRAAWRILGLLCALAVFTDVRHPVAVGAQDKGVVVVSSWGGSFQEAQRDSIFKPFERETGIKVEEATGPQLAKIRAMVMSNNTEWDVVNVVPGDMLVLAKNGLLEKIDYDRMDKKMLADVDQRVIHPFGIGNTFYSKVIAFNTKAYQQSNHPKSWAEVWDTKRFPGPRVVDACNYVVPPIEYALLADGVPPDKLYPLDLERGYRSLSKIRPQVVKWATSAAMNVQALVDGEAQVGAATLGRIAQLKEQGAPVDFEWNQALIQFDYWAIPKGARNYANAVKFIEFASRPEPLAALAKRQPLGPVNRRSFEFLPTERARMLPSYPENLAKQVFLNAEWWATTDASGKSNIEKNNEMCNAWMLK
jgi:putative spermidine/putrescine transport system substrate-binding protein